MADQNPRGDSNSVVLQLSDEHRGVLLQIFEAGACGTAEDLDRFRGKVPDPARRERELRIYERLIAALQGESIERDGEMSRILAETVKSFDRANEYGRVVAEHDALRSVIAQLGPPAEGGGDG